MTATDLLALASFGGKRLGQVIAIVVVVLIALAILIWASWKRRPPQE